MDTFSRQLPSTSLLTRKDRQFHAIDLIAGALRRNTIYLVPEDFVGALSAVHTVGENALDTPTRDAKWRQWGREAFERQSGKIHRVSSLPLEIGLGLGLAEFQLPWVIPSNFAATKQIVHRADYSRDRLCEVVKWVYAKWNQRPVTQTQSGQQLSETEKFFRSIRPDGTFDPSVGYFQRYLIGYEAEDTHLFCLLGHSLRIAIENARRDPATVTSIPSDFEYRYESYLHLVTVSAIFWKYAARLMLSDRTDMDAALTLSSFRWIGTRFGGRGWQSQMYTINVYEELRPTSRILIFIGNLADLNFDPFAPVHLSGVGVTNNAETRSTSSSPGGAACTVRERRVLPAGDSCASSVQESDFDLGMVPEDAAGATVPREVSRPPDPPFRLSDFDEIHWY